MKIEFDALHGKLHYSYPNEVDRAARSPADGSIIPCGSISRRLDGQIASHSTASRQRRDLRLARLAEPGIWRTASSTTPANIASGPDRSEPCVLAVQSDLEGRDASRCRRRSAKLAGETRPSTLSDDVRGRSATGSIFTSGTLRKDGCGSVTATCVGGSVGIGVRAAPERGDEDAVTDRGRARVAGSDGSFEGRAKQASTRAFRGA